MHSLFNDLIIFELANNHQGDVNHGLDIIKELGKLTREYNVKTAVKLQYRDLDTLIHPHYLHRDDVKHVPRFLKTRLTHEAFYSLVCAIRDEGMITMCTPFDEASVDLCMDHGIEIIKVASCSAMDWPLLEKVAETKKPVIVSTGGKTYYDMDKVYNFFTHRNVDFAMLHCIGLYPAEDAAIQLNAIDKMKKRYPDVPIGYSGHETPSDFSISMMAIAKGAKILERHIGKATDNITLNAYSTDVADVPIWLKAVKKARTICSGGETKVIPQLEIDSMNELARGCYAAQAIKKGESIRRDQVMFAMPCQDKQTTSGMFRDGLVATRDYQPLEAIFETVPRSPVSDFRSIIHDLKGMLYEAGVVVGKQFDLEISHHYGMQHFRHYGATLINIINREYSKKILLMLPGQINPTHYHKIKEETFQVLYGDLQLTLDGELKSLEAGDILTVERGVPHSFTSTKGCVFEEISTTHIRNDSYYEDDKIKKLDPMERKTILKDW